VADFQKHPLESAGPLSDYFDNRAEPAIDYPVLHGDRQTHTVIIGGGFTSWSCALALAVLTGELRSMVTLLLISA